MVAESGSNGPGPDSVESRPGLQITKDFMELVFEKPIKSFVTKSGSNAGDNYAGVLHAVKVIFEDNSNEEDIIIKSFPKHPARAAMLETAGMFEREYFVYNELFPAMTRIGGKNNKFKIAVPKFHGGNIRGIKSKFSSTPWENETFIIMTDLREGPSYCLSDRRQGLDFDHVKLVIEQLAVIHALSWVHKKKSNFMKLTEKYPLLKDFAFADDQTVATCGTAVLQVSQNAIISSCELVKAVLGLDHPAVEGLQRLTRGDMAKLLQMFLNSDGIDEDKVEELLRVKPDHNPHYLKDQWMVTTHGDSWCNNFLFKYDDIQNPTKPIDVKIIDFQLTREACPTLDLTYLLHCSVRTKNRKVHEKELLDLYYKTFCDVCTSTSTEVMPGFTYTNFLRRYRRAKIFGVIMALSYLSLFMLPPEVAENPDDNKASETLCEILENSFGEGLKNTELKDELVELALDLWEQGVL